MNMNRKKSLRGLILLFSITVTPVLIFLLSIQHVDSHAVAASSDPSIGNSDRRQIDDPACADRTQAEQALYLPIIHKVEDLRSGPTGQQQAISKRLPQSSKNGPANTDFDRDRHCDFR